MYERVALAASLCLPEKKKTRVEEVARATAVVWGDAAVIADHVVKRDAAEV